MLSGLNHDAPSPREALKFSATPAIGKTGVINTVKILLVEDSRSLRLENERAP